MYIALVCRIVIMVVMEYARLHNMKEVTSPVRMPAGNKWSQLGSGMSARAEASHPIGINILRLQNYCTHKYVFMRDEEVADVAVKVYCHVSMLFDAVVIRPVPLMNAVLQVQAQLQVGDPFSKITERRVAKVLVTCTLLSGRVVYQDTFKDAALKTLHLKQKVKAKLIADGNGSCNTEFQLVMMDGDRPLRGNAFVWFGSKQSSSSSSSSAKRKACTNNAPMKQSKLLKFWTNVKHADA